MESFVGEEMDKGHLSLGPWCFRTLTGKVDEMDYDAYSLPDVVPMSSVEELIYRTPAYISWQDPVWPVHCDDICAFLQYVGWKEIAPLYKNDPLLQQDVKQICRDHGWNMEKLPALLINDGWVQGYLFRCLHCNGHRLHVDYT